MDTGASVRSAFRADRAVAIVSRRSSDRGAGHANRSAGRPGRHGGGEGTWPHRTTHEGEPVLEWIARRTARYRLADTQFDDASLEYRRLFSEVWGTFLLVLVAAGGGVIGATAFGSELTLPMKALAPGMMVMGIIFFMGTISGAHLNPAVTLAFAVRGNFPWRRVPGYIVAELVGAILAAVFLNWMYGGIINGATEPTSDVSPLVAILTEADPDPRSGQRDPGYRLGCAQRGHQRRHRRRRVHRAGLGLGRSGHRRVDEPGPFPGARCWWAAT